MIESVEALRQLYPQASARSRAKQLDRLDEAMRRFVAHAPLCVLASAGTAGGLLDASPRGGPPGFVQVADERTLLIPDSTGNNRLDTLENLVADPRIGVLFLVPGVDEVLRVMSDLKKGGLTMLIVTHEMAFARDAADRVIFMDDGLIVEDGKPKDIFEAPRQERTAAFLKRSLRAL